MRGIRVRAKRFLVVTADDFGIGPATSEGILHLAGQGLVTGAVLLVNSPFAEVAVRDWRRAGQPMELGWHPCLTLDHPVTPADHVPTLVGPDGRFLPLGGLIRRLWLGRVRAAEVAVELHAQYTRYYELIGHPPTVVNTHHHVQIFEPVGAVLRDLLARQAVRPYVRRVREPWHTLVCVPGARGKRTFLSALGRRDARRQARAGLPGNDWLAGVTDPECVTDERFLVRWLRRMPGRVVELTCHPGFLDPTLLGRDCTPGDGQLQRRVCELDLLQQPSFRDACRRAGLTLAAPAELTRAAAA
jgi:predicted glycoside hydrolase/deacetylase ChbG (UPF0249 family)